MAKKSKVEKYVKPVKKGGAAKKPGALQQALMGGKK